MIKLASSFLFIFFVFSFASGANTNKYILNVHKAKNDLKLNGGQIVTEDSISSYPELSDLDVAWQTESLFVFGYHHSGSSMDRPNAKLLSSSQALYLQWYDENTSPVKTRDLVFSTHLAAVKFDKLKFTVIHVSGLQATPTTYHLEPGHEPQYCSLKLNEGSGRGFRKSESIGEIINKSRIGEFSELSDLNINWDTQSLFVYTYVHGGSGRDKPTAKLFEEDNILYLKWYDENPNPLRTKDLRFVTLLASVICDKNKLNTQLKVYGLQNKPHFYELSSDQNSIYHKNQDEVVAENTLVPDLTNPSQYIDQETGSDRHIYYSIKHVRIPSDAGSFDTFGEFVTKQSFNKYSDLIDLSDFEIDWSKESLFVYTYVHQGSSGDKPTPKVSPKDSSLRLEWYDANPSPVRTMDYVIQVSLSVVKFETAHVDSISVSGLQNQPEIFTLSTVTGSGEHIYL